MYTKDRNLLRSVRFTGLFIIGIAGCIAGSNVASASPEKDRPAGHGVSSGSAYDMMVPRLMTWIATNTDYDTKNLRSPEVIELSPQELTREAYSSNPMLVPADGVDKSYLALYSYEHGSNGTIYVLGPKWFDPDATADRYYEAYENPVFQERVLHELIHHVQHVSGAYKAFRCRNFGEKEAYMLGGRFLRQHHVDDPLPNRSFWALLRSLCGSETLLGR